MNCGKCNCAYLAIIVAILAGVALGVLFALGFIATGIVFWAYLAVGALSLLLAPVYARITSRGDGCSCYCRYRVIQLVAAIGAIITAAVGLIVAPVAGVVVVGIVVGVATLFVTLLLGTVVCLVNCLCEA